MLIGVIKKWVTQSPRDAWILAPGTRQYSANALIPAASRQPAHRHPANVYIRSSKSRGGESDVELSKSNNP